MTGPFSACTQLSAPSAPAARRAETGAVFEHQRAGIGHEELEAADALALDQGLHLGQRGGAGIEHDHVRADIHAGIGAAPVPVFQAGHQAGPGGGVQ
jgi:hypothetical protein